PGRLLAEAHGLLDPEPVRLSGERHLGLVTALLAHEAPGAARLFRRDRAALEQRDLQPAFGEPPGRAAADDAAADDRDVDRSRIASVRAAHPHTCSNTRRKLPPRIFSTSSSVKP